MWIMNEADRQRVPSSGRRGGLLIDQMQIQDDIQVIFNSNLYKIEGNYTLCKLLCNILENTTIIEYQIFYHAKIKSHGIYHIMKV